MTNPDMTLHLLSLPECVVFGSNNSWDLVAVFPSAITQFLSAIAQCLCALTSR